jgi:peptidyl-prolyl cis-trans isomerase SurA
MRSIIGSMVVAGLATLTSPLLSATPDVNGIAAIVNDSVITMQDVHEHVALPMEALKRTHGNNPSQLRQRSIETITSGLEDLIIRELILHDFKAAGIPVPDAVIEDEVQERVRKRFGDRVTLTKTLQAQGVRFETFRQRVYEDMVLQFMRQKNVRQAVVISPKKIEGFYTNNLTKFRLEDQVKLRMIVLNAAATGTAEEARKLAREIIVKLDEGAAFPEMAAIYSEGSQRTEGGDWGWRERNYLRRGLSDIAFNLNPGQRSALVGLGKADDDGYLIYLYDKAGQLAIVRKYSAKETLVEEKKVVPAEGEPGEATEFYLMLVEDKRPAHVRPLEQVRDEIEKELTVQEHARLQKAWIDRLRSKAFVRYFN